MTPTTGRRRLLEAIGAAGVAVTALPLAGCSAPSAEADDDERTPSPAPETTASTGGSSGDGAVATDTVEMTDELTFEPKRIAVSAGTTVTWETVGTIGHTVTAYEDEIPDGAAYFASGGFDSEEAARDGYPEAGNVTEGETYEHTFETRGTYGYFCVPHELNGMVGTVEVS